MKTFKEYTQEQEIQTMLFEFCWLLENSNEDGLLLEEVNTKEINDALSKVGLKIGRSRAGLIQQLIGAGKGVAQLIVAAIKGNTEKVKEIAHSVKPSDISELLFNLDTLTVSALGAPIKIIELVTGWKLSINFSSDKLKTALVSVRREIKTVRTRIKDIFAKSPERRDKYNRALKDIEKSLKSEVV